MRILVGFVALFSIRLAFTHINQATHKIIPKNINNDKTQKKYKTKNTKFKPFKTKTAMIQEVSLNILSTNASSLIHKSEDLKIKIICFKPGG